MIAYYLVDKKGIHVADRTHSNLEIYKQPSHHEKENFINLYNLPKDVFYFDDMPEIAPRVETLKNDQLGDVSIFVISNIKTNIKTNGKELSVEDRLESHTFILTNNKLFWFMDKHMSKMDELLLNVDDDGINSLEGVIATTGLIAYKNFASELERQKKRIDAFHKLAINSTSNDVLIGVADTERDMVLLQHTIETQEIAFDQLLEDQTFLSKLNNDLLVYDIKWYNRQVNQLVGVYRDLLEATSSLFTDIMSNNLNQLMKFLNTLSIILTSSSFIAGLWGMNTGGLPFEEHEYGTMIMLLVSFLAGLLMYLYLKNKDHFDD